MVGGGSLSLSPLASPFLFSLSLLASFASLFPCFPLLFHSVLLVIIVCPTPIWVSEPISRNNRAITTVLKQLQHKNKFASPLHHHRFSQPHKFTTTQSHNHPRCKQPNTYARTTILPNHCCKFFLFLKKRRKEKENQSENPKWMVSAATLQHPNPSCTVANDQDRIDHAACTTQTPSIPDASPTTAPLPQIVGRSRRPDSIVLATYFVRSSRRSPLTCTMSL